MAAVVSYLIPAIGNAQARSACIYTTCVPAIPFGNTDMLQIYGAILSSTAGGGGGSVSEVTVTTGNVGGFTAKPQVTVTADGTYGAGVNVGGIKTFTASRTGQRSGMITDVTLYDPSGANAALIIDIWAASPTGTFVNGTATGLNSPDKYLGSVSISASDYVKNGTVSRAYINGINLSYYSQSATLLYATVQTTPGGSGATFGVGTSVVISFGILRD